MAERKAQNKYYPPDWDPSKGSINYFHRSKKNTHIDRTPKDYGEGGVGSKVRFEMPFNVWCTGCENHIGKGVRYNSRKKEIGFYNAAYILAKGARMKIETFEAADNETIELKGFVCNFLDEKEAEKLNDPMYKLEYGNKDASRAKESIPRITELLDSNNRLWKDSFTSSQILRKAFREEKKMRVAEEKESFAIRDKNNLLFDVLPATHSDLIASKSVDFGVGVGSKALLRKLAPTRSIFKKPTNTRETKKVMAVANQGKPISNPKGAYFTSQDSQDSASTVQKVSDNQNSLLGVSEYLSSDGE